MHIEHCDERVVDYVNRYLEILDLPSGDLSITTNRDTFSRWLGRPVPFRIGGAYSMHPRTKAHRVFVHLDRLDPDCEHAIETVVAEELIHMRDHLRGDFRRHSHHGHDRIAFEVERLTGFSPEMQRSIFRERPVRLFRYLYRCPKCSTLVPRRRRGVWSCSRCSPRFNRRYLLQELAIDTAPSEARSFLDELNSRLLNPE